MKTIVLAAGKSDYRNFATSHSGSQLMSVVRGRPIIAWVVGDFLKNTVDPVTIVTRRNDEAFNAFLNQLYGHNPRVHVLPAVNEDDTILDSARYGLAYVGTGKQEPMRIILGDTLIRNIPYGQSDCICLAQTSDVSEKWCLTHLDGDGRVTRFFDKLKGLNTADYWTVVGRYEFADSDGFGVALESAIGKGARELSVALGLYAAERPFTPLMVEPGSWIDFGHLEGLAGATQGLVEARVFNAIEIHTPIPMLVKRSAATKKLEQEAFWYRELPDALQPLAPRVFGLQQIGEKMELRMEYYGYPSLTEKFVYAVLSTSFWQSVLEKLFCIAAEFSRIETPIESLVVNEMLAGKTFSRLEELKRQNPIWNKLLDFEKITINGHACLNISVMKEFVLAKSAAIASKAKGSVVHGDFCFNNILFEPVSGVVKLIDPRGEFGKGMSIYGDIRYDIAKLRHSFCGRYDYITEGLFCLHTLDIDGADVELKFMQHSVENADALFDDMASRFGFDAADIRFIESLLFLSMLPLHSDSLQKQKALFYQGLLTMNTCYEMDMVNLTRKLA